MPALLNVEINIRYSGKVGKVSCSLSWIFLVVANSNGVVLQPLEVVIKGEELVHFDR